MPKSGQSPAKTGAPGSARQGMRGGQAVNGSTPGRCGGWGICPPTPINPTRTPSRVDGQAGPPTGHGRESGDSACIPTARSPVALPLSCTATGAGSLSRLGPRLSTETPPVPPEHPRDQPRDPPATAVPVAMNTPGRCTWRKGNAPSYHRASRWAPLGQPTPRMAGCLSPLDKV